MLKKEPEEGLEQVVEAIKTCSLYKKAFFSKRDSIGQYFKEEDVPVVEWAFAPELIFARVDHFIARLTTIQVQYCDGNQFQPINFSLAPIKLSVCMNIYIKIVLFF